MTTAADILIRVRQQGAEIWLKENGNIGYRNCSPDLVEQLRRYKPDIVRLLRIHADCEGTAANSQHDPGSTPVMPKTFSRLELAQDALARLIPDQKVRRRIMAMAQADARKWRFLGVETYQHVLAGNVMDQVEAATGKLICFRGAHEQNRFNGWFTREVTP
ncbi:MAG: hypothetical protein M0Z50_11465 [Planctomycetia bacterium]|nr:hypothetical protein [Planctomycetia bacterium]